MGIIYSGPSGDQYEKWKKEHLAEQEAEKAKTIEAEVVESVKEVEAPKKAPTKKTTTK